jgi:hypothetical protein
VLKALLRKELAGDVLVAGHHPERRLLAPGHGLEVLQRVHVGKAAAHGHPQGQVALTEVQRVVQHQHVCGDTAVVQGAGA